MCRHVHLLFGAGVSSRALTLWRLFCLVARWRPGVGIDADALALGGGRTDARLTHGLADAATRRTPGLVTPDLLSAVALLISLISV